MSYGVGTVNVHKKLKLDKRGGSDNWYARLTLDNGKRIVKSTKTDDLEEAKERAIELYHDTKARIANNLPAQTRKFKHVAEYAIKQMQDALENGTGKQAYKDYISALRIWLIPYFGGTDVDKIDMAALKAFDAWRTEQNKKPFSQSGINNHNAALNRVFDEAVLQKWLIQSMRPTLLNKGIKSESRGSFTDAEYKKIYTKLRTWHKNTNNSKAAATREVLRNYVLFLANTGVRHGTEALELRWRNIAWHEKNGERFLTVSVDGKTRKRTAVARDNAQEYLDRQRQLNPSLAHETLDELLSTHSNELVFVTRLGEVATVHNLNRAFNPLLDELGLKLGTDGRSRTLYSFRHYYATKYLERGMTSHMLGKQIGTGTNMVDRHYSKYSPLMNAELHSGRSERTNQQEHQFAEKGSLAEIAFEMLAAGKLEEEALLAALGVDRANDARSKEIAIKALAARRDDLIDNKTLLTILNG